MPTSVQSIIAKTRRPPGLKLVAYDGSAIPREVPVPAVVRAVAMLRLLSSSSIPLGVNQIARELNIIPSTCLHILRALANEGFVTVNPDTKRYSLGMDSLSLAKAALRNSISDQTQPVLDEMTLKFKVTSLAVSLSGQDHYIVVAKSQLAQSFNLQVDLGSRFPALVSATGRCVAAYSGVQPQLLKTKFERLNWHRAPSFTEWQKQVAAVREQGYAIDDGNHISGVNIIASPILDSDGKFRHALVSVCIREGWTEAKLRSLAAFVRKGALQIAERLPTSSIPARDSV